MLGPRGVVLMLCVLLTGVSLVHAEPFTLEEIYQCVQDNEQLFLNFDCAYEERISRPLAEKDKRKDSAAVHVIDEEWLRAHFVCQNGLVYFKETKEGKTKKGPYNNTIILGYDGTLIKAIHYRNVKSGKEGYCSRISNELPEVPQALRPNLIGMRITGVSFAGYLQKHMKDDDPEWVLSVRLIGEQQYQGMPCVKLEFKSQMRNAPRGQDGASTNEVLLATARHFLPVKNTVIHGKLAPQPRSVHETFDWREIESGIFVPFKAVRTSYVRDSDGVIVADQKIDTEIMDISLHPKHTVSFFQDVPCEKGFVVYESNGKGVVKDYVFGNEGTAKLFKLFMRVRLLILIAASVLCLVGAFIYYRWAKRRRLNARL